jgi:drug/metabolite transporter (DMT)-like permease
VLVLLVTIVIASTLTGEEITSNLQVGAELVLAGVLVGALLPSKAKPAAVEECMSRAGQVLPRCT